MEAQANEHGGQGMSQDSDAPITISGAKGTMYHIRPSKVSMVRYDDFNEMEIIVDGVLLQIPSNRGMYKRVLAELGWKVAAPLNEMEVEKNDG